MQQRSTLPKTSDLAIEHTFRLREETLLRLTQQKTYYARRERTTSWSDFFDHVIGILEGIDPDSARPESGEWPGGLILTPRDQRQAEEELIAACPEPMLTRTFNVAFRAIKRMPFGPKRAHAFVSLINNWNAGEVGQDADIAHEVRRAHRKKTAAEALERLPHRFDSQLDPKNRVGLPTYERVLELAGLTGGRAALPEPRPALPAPREEP